MPDEQQRNRENLTVHRTPPARGTPPPTTSWVDSGHAFEELSKLVLRRAAADGCPFQRVPGAGRDFSWVQHILRG